MSRTSAFCIRQKISSVRQWCSALTPPLSGGRDLNKFDNALGARVNDALLNYETGETVVAPPRCRQASLPVSAIMHMIACPQVHVTSMRRV